MLNKISSFRCIFQVIYPREIEMSGLKSSYEIALEKMKEMEVDDVIKLTEEDKKNISGLFLTFSTQIRCRTF